MTGKGGVRVCFPYINFSTVPIVPQQSSHHVLNKYLTSTDIISDTLSNYFMGPIPTNSATLAFSDERGAYGTAMIPMLKRG